ncbi:hypothetical protein FXN63_16465 [Pigmentiphaga aceris]|uniref:Flagellar hook-length control protein-like C-terminal domain-containing protein n=1 Tax=Pigmentiphaga aceris TaxID=1940612 RepID=A0A5C0B259_9BURK|nr:flagellar hook-length control protein FliK [Pigmentiphaga aceris]QEI07260.1 hypothetical protein FXN63_16465 [Pigmentiphaga aceris]
MTTVSSPNADIAQQTRTAANRASSSSTTAKPDEQPADPFAALFDAAMLLQTEPTPAPVVSTTDKAGADTSLTDDASTTAEAPVDVATLLASMPWAAPTDAVVAKPVEAAPEASDDAAAGLAASELPATDTATLDPATIVAIPTPETASMVNQMGPANVAASGVRRAGQALGATTSGVEARSTSASDTDADIKTGQAADDSIDASPLANATAIEMAAAANAASARNVNAGNTGTGGNPEANTAASGVLASNTHASSTPVAAAATPATARQEVPTVPGPPVPLHAPQLQNRVDDAVRWMSTQSIQTAQIRVTPENMGPITVHVRMDGDTANVTFSSEHAQTRQVLEASMGGLRTALGEDGLQLGQAQVGSEQQNQQAFAAFANSSGDDRRARQAAADRMQATVSALSGRSEPVVQSGNGLVDLYA